MEIKIFPQPPTGCLKKDIKNYTKQNYRINENRLNYLLINSNQAKILLIMERNSIWKRK